jgi:hypothetical protein
MCSGWCRAPYVSTATRLHEASDDVTGAPRGVDFLGAEQEDARPPWCSRPAATWQPLPPPRGTSMALDDDGAGRRGTSCAPSCTPHLSNFQVRCRPRALRCHR